MFGYLPAPCRCQIGSEVDLYRSTFCGLCNALACHYGQPARLLINRDSTFVAMLVAAQAPEAPTAALSTRCQPWSRPMPVFESGPASEFASAVTICGLRAKLEDERADEHGLRATGCRMLAALLRRQFDDAYAVLSRSDFPVANVQQHLAEQSRIEADVVGGDDPAVAAHPSAHAFGSILAHTARLASNERNFDPLYEVGCNLGELAYTLDAYQDLQPDRRSGRFNFLAMQVDADSSSPDLSARGFAREIAKRCQRQIHQLWQEVELLRYRPVLETVLLTGLSTQTNRVLSDYRRQRPKTIRFSLPTDEIEDKTASGCKVGSLAWCSGCDCQACGDCCSDGDSNGECCECCECCDGCST